MNKIIEYKIGQNIRALREKVGITQEMLATKLQLEGCDITGSAPQKLRSDKDIFIPTRFI